MEENQIHIPEGWEINPLKDLMISKSNKAKQVKSSEYISSGSYPIIDQSDKFICGYWDELKNVIFEELPITVFGDHTRHTKFIDFPFVCGADGTQLIKPKNDIDDKFFYFLVCNSAKLIGNHGYDRHFKHLKNFQHLLPKSKTEQTQIATILTKVDDAITQTEQLIAKYTRIKTGLMQDLLTKGIDENGNIRSEETHEFKDSPLGRIPKEWEVTYVDCLCNEIIVGIVIRPTQYYIESGIPMLRSQNIKEEGVVMKDLVYMSEFDNHKLSKSKLSENDVVSVRTGYPGTSSVITKGIEGCNCIDLVISRPNQLLLNSHFLALFINSELGRKQILNHQSGVAQQHFNVGQMKELIIVKLTINEQLRILNQINCLNNQLTNFNTNLSKLQSLKTGLMQDLLSGKVRVNHLIKETASV